MTSWDRLAPLYGAQIGLERAALAAAAELAAPGVGERLLDLATGSGGLLRELAARDVRPATVIGLDSSLAMLRRVPALPPGWRLVRAPAEAAPFPAASFDAVTVAFLLHLLRPRQRSAVLAEARRLLRPRARIVVVTLAPPRRRRLGAIAARLARPLRGRGVLAGLCPLDPGRELERAGFALRSVQRTGHGYPALVVLAERV